MQQTRSTRTNEERSEGTRRALVAAARSLFIEKGFAAASTPQIVAAAGITRGALYHHFADKRALFRVVVELESRAVADAIEAGVPAGLDPVPSLIAGSRAYLAAMASPGRTRLLLVEGPSVLGSAAVAVLDEANAARTLRDGLEAALPDLGELSLAALAALLSAAFDRAALAIDQGADPQIYSSAMEVLVERLVRADRA